jgi:hypothetical protein
MSSFDGSIQPKAAQSKWTSAWSNILKWGYAVLALILLSGVAYYFYSVLKRPAAGILWFIGGGIIMFYYWVKWFTLKHLSNPNFLPNNTACPDYLSMIPPGTLDSKGGALYIPSSPTQYFCVDYVGVSRNGSLKKMDPKNIKDQINNPDYTFSVDPAKDFVSPASKAAFLQRLIGRGLSYNAAGEGGLPTQGSALPTYKAGCVA